MEPLQDHRTRYHRLPSSLAKQPSWRHQVMKLEGRNSVELGHFGECETKGGCGKSQRVVSALLHHKTGSECLFSFPHVTRHKHVYPILWPCMQSAGPDESRSAYSAWREIVFMVRSKQVSDSPGFCTPLAKGLFCRWDGAKVAEQVSCWPSSWVCPHFVLKSSSWSWAKCLSVGACVAGLCCCGSCCSNPRDCCHA